MWVRTPSAYEYGFYVRVIGEVRGKGETHGGVRVAVVGEMIVRGRGGDEGVDGGERVKRGDVY